MSKHLFNLASATLAILILVPKPLTAAEGAAESTASKKPAARAQLPTRHAYQQTLRRYLGSLTERDFDHGVTKTLTVSDAPLDLEDQYRLYLMTMMHQPLVGWKRGTPAVNAPSWLFLLSTIEGPAPPDSPSKDAPSTTAVPPAEKATSTTASSTPVPVPQPVGIVVPPVWPETLVAFTQWNYPGNPYYDNRGLKMRAFVTATVKMIMLDDYFEQHPEYGRADWNAYHLVTVGSTYLGVRDLLPVDVQQAYEAGLLKLGRLMLGWGVKGEEANKDLSVPIGLWYVAQACRDHEFK